MGVLFLFVVVAGEHGTPGERSREGRNVRDCRKERVSMFHANEGGLPLIPSPPARFPGTPRFEFREQLSLGNSRVAREEEEDAGRVRDAGVLRSPPASIIPGEVVLGDPTRFNRGAGKHLRRLSFFFFCCRSFCVPSRRANGARISQWPHSKTDRAGFLQRLRGLVLREIVRANVVMRSVLYSVS